MSNSNPNNEALPRVKFSIQELAILDRKYNEDPAEGYLFIQEKINREMRKRNKKVARKKEARLKNPKKNR